MVSTPFLQRKLWYVLRGIASPVRALPQLSVERLWRKRSTAPRLRWWWQTYLAATTVLRVGSRDALVPHEAPWASMRAARRGTTVPQPEALRQKRTHPFYIAPLSEYPALLSAGLGGLMASNVSYLHEGNFPLWSALALDLTLAVLVLWWQDLELLASSVAAYTRVVADNFSCGFLLFVVSEVMAFFGLFWGYLHLALNAAPVLGAVWPPAGQPVLEWYQWPSLSTALLVYSGFAANGFYYALKAASPRTFYFHTPHFPALRPHQRAELLSQSLDYKGNLEYPDNLRVDCQPEQPLESRVLNIRDEWGKAYSNVAPDKHWYPDGRDRRIRSGGRTAALKLRQRVRVVYGGLLYALGCGLLFLCCQGYEYSHAAYAMADGGYGTFFFALTGLHGLHVMAGLLLLLLVLLRLWRGTYVADNVPHVGPSAGVWYWHFVDAVWILLYLVVYLWGSSRWGSSGEELTPLTTAGPSAGAPIPSNPREL